MHFLAYNLSSVVCHCLCIVCVENVITSSNQAVKKIFVDMKRFHNTSWSSSTCRLIAAVYHRLLLQSAACIHASIISSSPTTKWYWLYCIINQCLAWNVVSRWVGICPPPDVFHLMRVSHFMWGSNAPLIPWQIQSPKSCHLVMKNWVWSTLLLNTFVCIFVKISSKRSLLGVLLHCKLLRGSDIIRWRSRSVDCQGQQTDTVTVDHVTVWKCSVLLSVTYVTKLRYTPWVKKPSHHSQFMSSPDIDRFWQFFHLHAKQEICNKATIKILTTP